MDEAEWEQLYELGIRGQHYESTGEIEKWIELYEYMILKKWDGSHIYDKLSIYYKKNKKYKDVERVITKFLEIYIIWLKNGNYPIQTDNKYIKFKKRLDSIKKYL